jgi:putative ABC transport system ATP-binding protein
MDEPTFIKIRGLRRVFPMGVRSRQKVVALAGVDLDIPRGSFTVIMGPSGSGKSTLLYMLGGLDVPTAGSIEVDGLKLETLDANGLAMYRRKTVGFVFQSFNLVGTMKAVDNVEFPLRFAGVGKKERLQRAVELLKDVGLEKRIHHLPTELSGGEQQRVAIARALVFNPPLILADEPTGNLDSTSGADILRHLLRLHDKGHTVVVVTHDKRVQQLATHKYFFKDGKTVDEAEYNTGLLGILETLQKGATP